MNNLINKTRLTLESFFLLKPNFLSTLLFFPLLYILGWILAKIILLNGLLAVNISLIGTIFTFLLFIFLMPLWFKVRWNIKNSWFLLGIKTNKNSKNIFYFLKGFILSLILLTLILIPLFRGGWVTWIGELSLGTIFNFVLLTFGIGLAEELIFRGWLFEDLKFIYGIRSSAIIQALIFSLVHLRINSQFWDMLITLLGLFLLGILLILVRLKNKSNLWECIGLHGCLVSIWFSLNNGLIEISSDAPKWLIGPGIENRNPIGGFYGILILFFSCIIYVKKVKQNINNNPTI